MLALVYLRTGMGELTLPRTYCHSQNFHLLNLPYISRRQHCPDHHHHHPLSQNLLTSEQSRFGMTVMLRGRICHSKRAPKSRGREETSMRLKTVRRQDRRALRRANGGRTRPPARSADR